METVDYKAKIDQFEEDIVKISRSFQAHLETTKASYESETLFHTDLKGFYAKSKNDVIRGSYGESAYKLAEQSELESKRVLDLVCIP